MAGLLIVATPILIASQRRSVRPILDFALFRNPGYSFGLGVLVCHYTSLSAILLLAPFFFIDALGFSATKMGLFIMLHTLMRVFIAPISGALTPRIGAWTLSGVGLVAMVASLAWLSLLAVSGSEEAILAALLLVGVASGLYEPPNTTTIMGVGACGQVWDRLGVDSIGTAALLFRRRSRGGRHLRRARASVPGSIRGRRVVRSPWVSRTHFSRESCSPALGVVVSIAAIYVTRRRAV